MRRLPLPLGLAAALLLALRAAPAGEPIVTTDLLRMRSVSAIDVAWDGARAVLAVRSIGSGPREDDAGAERADPVWRNQSHLYLVDLGAAGAPSRQLTFGDRLDTGPQLSPDGRRIAFVRRRGSPEATGQVWVMPVDGGEARPVTDLAHGADAPRWSPDGRALLVTSRIPADELPEAPAWASERPRRQARDAGDAEPRPAGTREEIRAWLAQNEGGANPVVISRLDFQDETRLKPGLEFQQLFIVPVDEPDGAVRRLTSAPRDHRDAAFMPDGESVLYSARRETGRHPDRDLETSIRRLHLENAEDAELLAGEGWSFRGPRPGADGSVVAFTASRTDEPSFRPRRLGIALVTGSGPLNPLWLTGERGPELSVGAFRWRPSRSSLIFTAARRGGFPLFEMGEGLIEPAPVVEAEDDLPIGVHAFDSNGGAIVYTVTGADNPCVVRVRDARGDRLVLDLNPWVAEKDLARLVPGHVTRPDGTEVRYWIMEPTNRDPARSSPLALEIHGGPGAMWGPGEFTMWHEFQLLCSWGYGVVYANPRGSGGYGSDFRRANFQDWGEGPAGDVLAVVDAAVLADWVDEQRLVVTGGSYGGYLTAWIVANDHRFSAAVAQRGVYDLATFFGEGNAWRLVRWGMGGWPWEPRIRPVLQRESPFGSVTRIRTPLLILHGSADLRTGVSQSEMLYRALKQLGRPVEYVRYPGAGHDLSRTGDPRQRLDRLNRIIEFFDRFSGNDRPAPQAGAAS